MGKAWMIGLLLLLALPVKAQVYKWVDEQGRVHYGDKPHGIEAQSVPVRPAPTTGPSAEPPQDRDEAQRRLLHDLEQDRLEREEARERKTQEQARRERNCALARDRLRRLESAGLLYDLDAQGDRRVLGDAERLAAEEQARRAVQQWCAGP